MVMAEFRQLTITGDQIEGLTGLTDRRLRQLAKAGYFPPPERGQYQYAATIRGLFKYYREDHHNTSRTLNDAKLSKLKADAEMSKLKVQQARKETIPRQQVSEFLRAWAAKLDLLLTAELENNVPNLVLGLSIADIRREMVACHDRIREMTHRGFRTWEDDNPIYDGPLDLPDDDNEAAESEE
jgi:hypothetical protein